jgi:pseudo-response regulator 5
VLKGRSHDIDLILTEVELPSISGFALLTLIMEHDICKNIPVISMMQSLKLRATFLDLYQVIDVHELTLLPFHAVMSSQDSVSTVYKCMLRGAADFLVKPVRKNELRNLWQHVWRRQAVSAIVTLFQHYSFLMFLATQKYQSHGIVLNFILSYQSSNVGPGPPDESVAQQKVEATAENNAISNYSSDYMACIQRNRECIEKGTDAQVIVFALEDIPFTLEAELLILKLKGIFKEVCLCYILVSLAFLGLKTYREQLDT